MDALIIILIIISLIASIFLFYFTIKKRIEFKNKLKDIFEKEKKISVNEFFQIYNDAKKITKLSNIEKSGVYILFNITQNKYYVGQSRNIFKRVNNHFTGKGNGDVYADYKYGNNFEITLVKCPIDELNKTEKYYIEIFDSYHNGYNKNKGNW